MGFKGKKQENALNALEAAADALQLPQIGEIIADRYRVTENLGKGAVGWVWGVEHLKLGQRFAMKFLLPSIASNQSWLDRFREEARITSMLGHENIVFVTEFGTSEKYGPFLVMEYLEGESLADILGKQPKLPLQKILRFAVSISSALSAVNELGIVHCDLKPNNLYLSKKTWKVLDFGISNLVTQVVETDKIFGTPRYMSPEQAIGLKLDGRADQFSLGVILYEMLTGQTPWKLNSWADAMPESRERYSVPAPSRISERPAALDAPILRAISIRRQDRFPTSDDFIEAILENVEFELEPSFNPIETDQPQVIFSDPTRQSMHIGVEKNDSNPRFIVTFRNADRLRREYRRNLIAGRLYVTSETKLPVGTSVGIDLVFGPKNTKVKLIGTITDLDKQGFGVRIDPLFRKSLNQFLKEHRLGFGYLQHDILLPIERSSDVALSVGEALLLTKIASGNHSLNSLRALSSGIPIDFEHCVSLLIERDFAHLSQGGMVVSSVILEDSVVLDESKKEIPFSASEVTEKTTKLREKTRRLKVDVSETDVDRILLKSQRFVEQGNYLGAISILESISDVVADAKLHLALANLFDSFSDDRMAAEKHRVLAAGLDPSPVGLIDDSIAITRDDVPSYAEE